MDSKEVLLLKKALVRQKKARAQAEKILEQKSKELYDATRHLKETNDRLESLLSEKTSELEGVFINILDPYVVMDLEFNVIKMNPSAKAFLGFDNDKELVNLASLVHPEYKEYTSESIKTLVTVGTLKNYRARIQVKDGSEKFIHVNSSIIYDKFRKPIAAQGIIRDVTQEMEIKHLLAEQKKELDIIVENSPMGIALLIDGIFIKTNESFRNLLGYSDAEFKKLHVRDISFAEDLEESKKRMEELQLGEIEHFSLTKRYVKKDGSIVWAKNTISVVKNAVGKIEYQVAMIEDITNQRLLEKQKEKLLKELESSNTSLQEYAHVVSHDLKSPLRSISALVSWLQEDYNDVLDEDGQQNLRMMQEKVSSMDKLIHGILEYSTANNSKLENKEVDLNKVIKAIKESIFIPDHVELKVPQPLPKIICDKTKIHQLFQNIIGNAVSHIDKKNGLVNVICTEKENHWQFTIEDNGVGIDEKYHKKIFEIFQSIGNNVGSTGIGLSIVKKIVDRYGGEVWLDSELGKGTEFHFTLKK